MCTLVVLRQPGGRWPLLAAANRDEMRGRSWRAPGRHWPDRPHVVAGLDEAAGGSWLGVNDQGVLAAVLNRHGTLGRMDDKRSRGLLVLDALDHGNARSAAEALGREDPGRYQPFNLVVADRTDAYWLKHAGPDGTETERGRIRVEALPSGVSMLTAGNLNDATDPRIRRHLPRFLKAAPPDPDTDSWDSWTRLLGVRPPDHAADPREGMAFETDSGFATLCSTLVALPAGQAPPVLRFADGPPDRAPFRPIAA
ncbi:Transport and Golgi organisation 2 [Limimonas halophila]|uniref:Transport and Golgi organisation 2 n=2 Tax=Limimonas halophila TaxID=1082479 RepID=A0A1G7V8M3_9PROT|nr:Transport and Golgi organisation 2 [Limimonas halophila]